MRRIAFALFLIGVLAGPALAQSDAAAHVDLLDPSAARTYGDEATDVGVKPQDKLRDDAHIDTHTPTSIPGGKVITTGELAKVVSDADADVLIFDTLETHGPHRPVPGAIVWTYPNRSGTFTDAVQSDLKSTLTAIVKDDIWFPMVFYCAGSDCWQGYNAALRAIHAGYRNVYWYRGGAEAWASYNIEQSQAASGTAK